MPELNKVGDPDTGRGVVQSSSETWFTVLGKVVSVNNSPVSSHGEGVHSNARTANGSTFFTVGGQSVNRNGDADTCGHTRNSRDNFMSID